MEMETNMVKGYIAAYKLACEELPKRSPAQVCLNAAVAFSTNEDIYHVKYLDKVYKISASTGDIGRIDSEEEVSASVKVLLLHYLLNVSNRPLSGNMISFRELKNGAAIYYPSFYKRAVVPLIKTFGNCVEDLYKTSVKLNGVREKFGHASVTINILPMVPVTYVLWEGEEDIPASGTILFDDSVEFFLPAEDIVCAGSFGTYELIRLKHENEINVQA